MPEQSVIVWDLETVPDLAAAARMLDLPKATDTELRDCPVDAIKPDTEPGAEKWLSLNAEYARLWPNISLKKEPPADAKEWERVPDKAQYFSAKSWCRHVIQNRPASATAYWRFQDVRCARL